MSEKKMGNAATALARCFSAKSQRPACDVTAPLAAPLAASEPCGAVGTVGTVSPVATVPRRRVPQTERHAIALRFEHRCACCRVLLPVGWHLDHRVPLADGGADDASNMQPLCTPCHTLKTARENAGRVVAPLAPLGAAAPSASLGPASPVRSAVSVSVTVSRSRGQCAVDHRPQGISGANGAVASGAVDMRRAIVLTEKCAANFSKWREKGESFRVDRYVRISGKSMNMLLLEKALVQKTRNAAALAPYGVCDLKHDLKCGFVELGVTI